MAMYRSKDHHLVTATAWNPQAPAGRINDFLLMSRGTSNCYAITSPDGDVIINTGTSMEGEVASRHFEDLLGRPLSVNAIVLTQSHPDHAGGWGSFAEPHTRTYAQRRFPVLDWEKRLLKPFYNLRRDAVLHSILESAQMSGGNFSKNWKVAPEISFTELFQDRTAFEVAGRRYELFSAPGGETSDSIFVWMPQERIAFIGNWAGALYGALPNFYTLRGDRDRSVAQWLCDLDLLIGLEAEVLVPGHDEPIHGANRILHDLEELRHVVSHIHDETVRGMNEGKDMWSLMREVGIPAGVSMAPGRGPARWIVRAVWEEYAGWFRHERTSELYSTSPATIWPELCVMVGGPDALAARASDVLAAGDAETALHWVEIALAGPGDRTSARRVELAIIETLIERNANQHFDEICWLETRERMAREALDQAD